MGLMWTHSQNGTNCTSGTVGPWGGNMDYNEFREGVTLYLPVFQPGALLFLGDGHAAQGDGELTGDEEASGR